MNGKTIFIIGATSSLGQALCRTLAVKGYRLALAGRDAGELELLAADLATRFGINCQVLIADFMDAHFSPTLLMEQAGDYDSVIIATGDMGNGDPFSLYNLAYAVHINYTLPAQLATLAARYLSEKKKIEHPVERRQRGGRPRRRPKGERSIVIISSIAGDRGRQSNYAYGSAKAALSAFASGLRNRFYKKGVRVMTVKPGFIDTPMTWGMTSPLIASREAVAKEIISAMERKKDVIYVPWFWRYIMLIICAIPERVFKRLSL
jgi:decaprenylphospho-beta-D-erythro-pentofuranosid-2-ulose 2-reductase